jgi:hypothetical protein
MAQDSAQLEETRSVDLKPVVKGTAISTESADVLIPYPFIVFSLHLKHGM